jgi:formylglycine-generating enzyme required for sulfatase activity
MTETRQHSHPFWISKYPVMNYQYERFLRDRYFNPHVGLNYRGVEGWDNRDYWGNIPMFEPDRAETKRTDLHSGNAGRKWIMERLNEPRDWYDPNGDEYMVFPNQDDPDGERKIYPRHWGNPDFGNVRKNVPVVGVTWYEASAYCKWLEKNWNDLEESKVNKEIRWPSQIWIRLPTRHEWEMAAGGKYPGNRYPWDKPGNITHDIQEIFERANVAYQIGRTTPVDKYPKGASPRGVMDMSGNVWEWLSNISQPGKTLADIAGGVPQDEVPSYGLMEMIGGSWKRPEKDANLSGEYATFPDEDTDDLGFRVVIVKM